MNEKYVQENEHEDDEADFIQVEKVQELFTSLDLNEASFLEDQPLKTPSPFRRDGLHLNGVDEMKTQEIFEFFSDYNPYALEWINDSSCNVLWKNENKVLRAITDLTEAYDPAELTTRKFLSKPAKNMKWRISKKPAMVKNANRLFHIFVRFIRTLSDRKQKGAESKSRFYVKYGNPNYGNLRGLISESKRKEMKARQFAMINSTFQSGEPLDLDKIDASTAEIENDEDENKRKLVSYNFGKHHLLYQVFNGLESPKII